MGHAALHGDRAELITRTQRAATRGDERTFDRAHCRPVAELPETRYARSGDVHIAYQVTGDGPFDLVGVPGFASNVELAWEQPAFARWNRRLASFCRRIVFDKRGTGLSDKVAYAPSLEQRIDDLRAVMDAAGSGCAALMGEGMGAALCVLFAATYPERTKALVLIGAYARALRAPDYPWGPSGEQYERIVEYVERNWGRGVVIGRGAYPHLMHDERMRRWFGRWERNSASPGDIAALMRVNASTDVRHVLSAVRVATLVLHRTGDPTTSVEHGRYLARHIPGARYVELPGDFLAAYYEDVVEELDEVEAFLTGVRRGPEPDRVLATLLFTDIVGSTEHAVRLSDEGWRTLLDRHDETVRRELARYRGREIATAGDGFLAVFDGPARAIRCAQAISHAARELRIDVRCGLHTGEIQLRGTDDVGGIAVHIAQRVSTLAAPAEVLVSPTVKDLVAGSGIEFTDRGTHTLRGIPDEWRLFAVRE